MSYPAFAAFFDHPERTTARACVYMALQPPFLSLNPKEPRAAKIEVVRARARISIGATSQALRWLEQQGFIIVHDRDQRGMASMTLAYDVRLPSVNRIAG